MSAIAATGGECAAPRTRSGRSLATCLVFLVFVCVELLFFYVEKFSLLGVQVRYFTTVAICALALAKVSYAGYRRGTLSLVRFNLKLLAVVTLFVLNALVLAVLQGNFAPGQALILMIQPAVLFFSLIAVFSAHPLRLVGVVLAVCTASSVLAVLQYLNFPPAWDVQRYFAEGISSGYRLYGRVAGLTADPVRLSYLSLLGASIALGLMQARHGRPWLFMGVFLVNAAATVFSGTRSAVLALVVVMALAVYGRIRKADRLAAIALAAIALLIAYPALLLVSEFSENRFLSTHDISSLSRGVLLEAALHQIAAMPFGIGFASFAEAAGKLDIYWGEASEVARYAIGTFEPHNYFINFVVYYGVQGLAIIGAFFYLLFGASVRAMASEQPEAAAIGRVGLFCLVSFIVHVLAHNSGPFNGDTSLLMVLAAVVAAASSRRAKGLIREAGD